MPMPTSIDRRTLLTRAMTAAAALAWPAWMAACVRRGARPVTWSTAKGEGKPILVFVVPKDDSKKHWRGTTFGAFLMHGGDEALADVAVCRVRCATVDEVEAFAPGATGGREPWLVLIETHGETPRGTPIGVKFPETKDEPSAGFSERAKREDAEIRARIALLATAVSAAVSPDEETILRRAAEAREHLPNEVVERVGAAVEAGMPGRPDDLGPAAAVFRLGMEHVPAQRTVWTRQLADQARREVVTAPPPGAKWATSGGCGTTVEGEENDGPRVACGMAMVPDVARRFLWFFSRKS
jgi:hypothetical protein